MSGCRRLRRVMERSATRRAPDLFGPTDSGIGAAETGSGLEEAGSVRRDRAQFGSLTVGSRKATATAWSAATGGGRSAQSKSPPLPVT